MAAVISAAGAGNFYLEDKLDISYGHGGKAHGCSNKRRRRRKFFVALMGENMQLSVLLLQNTRQGRGCPEIFFQEFEKMSQNFRCVSRI